MFLGIQGLRFFAAALIVLYHVIHYSLDMKVVAADGLTRSPPMLSSGTTVFFVISGFLMAGLIERTPPARFLAHRILRIYPAYLIAVALVCAAKIAIFGDFPPFMVARALTLFPSGPMPYPLGVEWTLVYEVFFYFVSTALCFMPSAAVQKTCVAAWAVLLVVANGGLAGRFTAHLPTAGQIAFSYFNAAFIAGMVIWWSRDKISLPPLPAFAAGLLIIVLAYRIPDDGPLVARYLISVVGAVLLVKAASEPRTTALFARRYSLLTTLGDGSYGLYLLHVPVITIIFATFSHQGIGLSAFAMAAAFLLGSLYGLAEFRIYRDVLRRIDIDVNVSFLPAKANRISGEPDAVTKPKPAAAVAK